MPTND